MQLLVAVVNEPDKLDEILSGFVELGITGATVIGSEGSPANSATPFRLASPGCCSSEPTIATGTMGVSVSSARRMKPCPKSSRR